MSNVILFPLATFDRPIAGAVIEYKNRQAQPVLYDFTLEQAKIADVKNILLEFFEVGQSREDDMDAVELAAYFFAERIVDMEDNNA